MEFYYKYDPRKIKKNVNKDFSYIDCHTIINEINKLETKKNEKNKSIIKLQNNKNIVNYGIINMYREDIKLLDKLIENKMKEAYLIYSNISRLSNFDFNYDGDFYNHVLILLNTFYPSKNYKFKKMSLSDICDPDDGLGYLVYNTNYYLYYPVVLENSINNCKYNNKNDFFNKFYSNKMLLIKDSPTSLYGQYAKLDDDVITSSFSHFKIVKEYIDYVINYMIKNNVQKINNETSNALLFQFIKLKNKKYVDSDDYVKKNRSLKQKI